MSDLRKPKIEAVTYTIPEVAALLNVGLNNAYELARSAGFPAVRVGKRLIVPRTAFENWLARGGE